MLQLENLSENKPTFPNTGAHSTREDEVVHTDLCQPIHLTFLEGLIFRDLGRG